MPAPHAHDPTGEFLIQVNGVQIEGWKTSACCIACHGSLVHYLVFDALFCPQCNTWAVVLCDDPGCMYCRVRPVRPFFRAA